MLFCCISCVSSLHNDIIETGRSQVELRSYQTYVFENEDLNFVLKNIISTMQDLDFIIDRVDNDLLIISGTSFDNGSRLTVTARKNGKNVVIRANAQTNNGSIIDPKPYQNFFDALSQSIFLSKHI